MSTTDHLNTDWRKVASTIYKKPVDSKIYGQTELDVTLVEEFIAKKRKEGLKITLTHIVVLMISRALQVESPELNSYVRRGKIVARKQIDAMVSVLLAKDQMGSVKVENSNTLNLEQLVDIMTEEIKKSRKGSENDAMQSKNLLSSLPWPLRGWLFKLYKTLTIDWGITIPKLGLSPDSFGSFMVTNIGSIGLDTGFPALLPSSNIAFVFTMGGVFKKPVVINDEIVIRRMMSISVVMDHRISDASHAGKMLRYMKFIMKNPESLMTHL